MGLFGRRSKGRHALGAAVTSIPFGPVRLSAGTPAPPVVPGGVPAGTPTAAVVELDVSSSIAALIATGEAWCSEAEIVADLRAPVVAPVLDEPVVAPAVQPVAAAVAPVAVPAPPPPISAATAPSPPRIQLGFRDGTSTTLEADSEEALALELLAQSLTRLD
jgi:hypothetical protein